MQHYRIRYILGATGEGRRKLGRNPGGVLNNNDYIFIDSDEMVRAWLLSNPVLDNPLDLLVYCYRNWIDKNAETPPLNRVNYLDQTPFQNWARDPAQHIGQMHSRAISDDRSVHSADNDTNQWHEDEDDASNYSVTSTDMSDSPTRAEIPFTILPSPAVGVARWLANRIPLLAKSLSQQNQQPPWNILHQSAKGGYGPMECVQFNDQNTPQKRNLNYLLKEFRRSDETRKRRTGIDAENMEDPESQRVCTGAGSESLTGELIESIVCRLSEMSP